MLSHAIAILGLAALCVGWVLVQRWAIRSGTDAGDVPGRCGACGGPAGGCGPNEPSPDAEGGPGAEAARGGPPTTRHPRATTSGR